MYDSGFLGKLKSIQELKSVENEISTIECIPELNNLIAKVVVNNKTRGRNARFGSAQTELNAELRMIRMNEQR